MTRGRDLTAAVLLLVSATSCLGYDPTPPPAARLTFTLDLPAGTRAAVKIHDDGDQLVGSVEAEGGAQVTVPLQASRDYGALRIVGRAGERVLKALVPAAKRNDLLEVGRLDAASTAAAQVIQDKVAGQGGTFSSVPQTAVAGLVDQVRNGSTELKTFADLVRKVVDRARLDTDASVAPAFADLDALLADAFVVAHKELGGNFAADYRNALTAVVGKLEMSLICDASLVKVMFAVDASGEAVDGNGAPQLMRQPNKAGKVFLAITVDDTSPLADSSGLLKRQMTPNDPDTLMFDDGTNGDEKAGDGVFTRVLVLPRGMRVKYKYTNGSAGEGWTRTEEWPGNARVLEVQDVLSRNADGSPDCLVIRRDVFGDEATNKNFVNLNSKIKGSGGTLGFDKDLGGPAAAKVAEGRWSGGLKLGDTRSTPALSPDGLPEAAENGVCARCPAPLTLSTDDKVAPAIVVAELTSTTRVKVSFSEAMEFSSASLVKNYLILDSAQRALPIHSAAASGAVVTLEVAPVDFGQRYTLYAKNLKDASANANALSAEQSSVTIGRDRTPPQVVSVQALPLRDFNPGALGASPEVGQVVLVTFDEEIDGASAENAGNYQVQGLAGADLKVLAAFRRDGSRAWLITEAQGKRKPYQLLATNVRDVAGNPLRLADPVRFTGFALYKVTFGAVPGFAFLDLRGTRRGLPKGAGLYLTGTILSVARDLQGNATGIAGRTDVTGIPEFEMKPGPQVYKGEPVYTITLLAPPGTYAWKVAHGTPGEHKTPPPTLEKVHKSLCTTADATGVNIDPATLTALPLPGPDGKPTSFVDYAKAALSKTGQEPPGPFTIKAGETLPAPTIMFKRENPDEVCSVQGSDVACPAIVVGTWRDLGEYVVNGKRNDFDDGLPEVDPVRVQTDLFAPKLRDLKVRDSESLLLSFDERLVVQAATLKLGARNAKSGTALKVSVEAIGAIGATLLPHQILLRTAKMDNGASYTLSYDAMVDAYGNGQPVGLQQSWVAPQSYQPFTPLADTTPPKVLGVLPKSPTSLLVQFSKKIAPSDGSNSGHFSILADSGTPPSILGAAVQGGGTTVLLSTGLQAQQGAYTLVVQSISDLATPPNVLVEQKIKFKGFGDTTPPKVTYAAAISPTEVAVAFDEALAPLTAAAATSYQLGNVTVVSVGFSGDPAIKAAAFDAARTTYGDNVVVLQTTKMTAGQSYSLIPSGVTDLTGNACKDSVSFKGVAAPPKVNVVFSYKVSQSDVVAGIIPPRAISTATLAAQREGVFMLGSSVSVDGQTKGAASDPINAQLGGFPPEGQPIVGLVPQLLDNGQFPDLKAGDGIFSLLVKDVPLGTCLLWKAFASYTVSYKTANPGDAQAAFADAKPGPSVFSDGQEFPGNEDAIRILGDKNGDGVVRINLVFGDEITYKKLTNTSPFVWVVDDVTWTP